LVKDYVAFILSLKDIPEGEAKMLKVYINYPNCHLTVHGDPDCGYIQAMGKPNQRICRINATSISAELLKFKEGKYQFQSSSALNDMWLEIEFGNKEFELAVTYYIHNLLGRQYRPFVDAQVKEHC
jgi:hypothetical protein